MFDIWTLCCMAVFYGCYFIKLLRQRLRGIRTDQLGRGKKGFVRLIEGLLKLLTWLVPVTELLSIAMDTHALPQAFRIVGLIFSTLACLVFLLAIVQMRDNWRAGVSPEEKTDLVTGGIYSLSRNPAFLGFDMLYLGILLTYFNVGLFAVTAAAALLFHLQIVNVEEPFLLERFGEAYLAYQKQVRRYLGRKKFP